MRSQNPGSTEQVGFLSNNLQDFRSFGPQSDHTTGEASGFYFWVSKPNGTEFVDYLYTTQLIINNLNATDFYAQCLSFWYQIHTPTTKAFYIYKATTTQTSYDDKIWEAPFNNFDRWTRGEVTISASYKHKVVFSLYLSRTAPATSFIALDDISVRNGACEVPVSCDFDDDMCSWYNVKTQQANWNWARFIGNLKFIMNWYLNYDMIYRTS